MSRQSDSHGRRSCAADRNAAIAADFDDIARLSGDSEGGGWRWVTRRVPRDARRILDVGCGTGGLASALARPDRQITGIDLSPEMIRRARARASGIAGVAFEVGDLMTWLPASQPFDAIVSVAALHHVDLVPAVRRLASWLGPGGRLVIVDLWRIAGPVDVAVSAIVAPIARLRGAWSMINGASPRALRRAWDRHGRRDQYLSMAEARSAFPRLLPGCRVRRHWAWRYSVVWDKP